MELLVDEAIDRYAFSNTSAEPAYLQALEKRTREEMDNPQMLTGRVEGRLLKLIVQLCEPRFVLEVGTFTGGLSDQRGGRADVAVQIVAAAGLNEADGKGAAHAASPCRSSSSSPFASRA